MQISKAKQLPNNSQHLFLIIALGINCTIGYGTLFYSFSLLSLEITQHFSWSKEFVYGVYSSGIIFSAILAPLFGKILDRYGTQLPMTLGSLIVVISLVSMSIVNTKVGYILSILLLEVAAVLVVYESAFVALTQALGSSARRAITQITLMGGFASTIFWPLIDALLNIVDWQTIYLLMAVLHALVCMPLHWLALQPLACKNTKHMNGSKSDDGKTIINRNPNHDYTIELMIAFTVGVIAFCINGTQIHFFTLMKGLNIAEASGVLASALIGPSQVVARILEMTLGQKISPLKIGIISTSMMLISLIGLSLATIISTQLALLFAVFFGIGQGLNYIIRGTIPLYIFGNQQYGTITGRINAVRILLTAAAPISFSLMIDQYSVHHTLMLMMGLLTLCSLALLFIDQHHKIKQRTPSLV